MRPGAVIGALVVFQPLHARLIRLRVGETVFGSAIDDHLPIQAGVVHLGNGFNPVDQFWGNGIRVGDQITPSGPECVWSCRSQAGKSPERGLCPWVFAQPKLVLQSAGHAGGFVFFRQLKGLAWHVLRVVSRKALGRRDSCDPALIYYMM